MESVFFYFLENMALIIALLYLGLKIEEIILAKVRNPLRFIWLSSAFIGFLAISIMFHPFEHQGMRIDLREVPIFFITYLGGWKLGVLSAILPGIFRFSLGGPTVVQGIIQTIILPLVMGILFHKKTNFLPPYTIVHIRHMAGGFLVFQLIKSLMMYMTTPITLPIIFLMSVFSLIALVGMGLMVNDFNQKELSRKELEFLSHYDPMTALPNIRYFKKEVQQLISQKVPVAVAMIDVDHFKTYNDTHGHQAGDEVLRSVGKILMENIRQGDYIARYGGEEFIICYGNHEGNKETMAAVERFQEKVKEYRFEGEQSQPGGKLTVSVGISFLNDHKTLEDLIGEADQALYRSKRAGRNRITVFK